MKISDITQEMFNDMLLKVVDEEKPSSLILIPGVYECVSEYYNNEVIDRILRGQQRITTLRK